MVCRALGLFKPTSLWPAFKFLDVGTANAVRARGKLERDRSSREGNNRNPQEARRKALQMGRQIIFGSITLKSLAGWSAVAL